MPTKPTNKTLTAKTPDILSSIQNNSSQVFKDNVTDDMISALYDDNASVRLSALREIGEVITTLQPVRNEFLSNLVNRIAFVIVTSKVYQNPWSMFKKGYLELGETVEEIFVKLAEPHKYDPEKAEEEFMRREIPDVLAVFHSVNYTEFYKRTIQRNDLRTAFLSWDGVVDLINKIIESMYTANNLDEFLLFKYMIAKAYLKGNIKKMHVDDITTDNAKDVTIQVKELSDLLTFMSDEYNEQGVDTFVDKQDQFLILTPKYNSTLDVAVLATSFNMDKAEFMGHRVLVDGFDKYNRRIDKIFKNYDWYVPFTEDELTKLKALKGLIVDVDWFKIYDQTFETTNNFNGEGLYWNYWLHVHKIISYSPYCAAIALTTDEVDNPTSQVDNNIVMLSKQPDVVDNATSQVDNNTLKQSE